MEILNDGTSNIKNNKRKIGDPSLNKAIIEVPENCQIHNVIMDGKTGIEQLQNVDPDDLVMISSVIDIGSKLIATKEKEMSVHIIDNIQKLENIILREYIIALLFPFGTKISKHHILLIEDINQLRIGSNNWESGVEDKLNKIYLQITISSYKNPIIIKESHYIHRQITRSLIQLTNNDDGQDPKHGESVKRKKPNNDDKKK